MIPILLGATALVIFALAKSGKAKAGEVGPKMVPVKLTKSEQRKLASITPSKALGGGGKIPVRFTSKTVLWRINKKTGKKDTRIQIVETPAELAAAASQALGREITPEVFALATLMASEAGSGSDLAKAAIAHAALTYTAKHGKGKGLLGVLAPDGHFGGQQGRYASTRQPPRISDLELADAIVTGKVANPSPGAIKWDSPKTQDILHRKGVPGHRSAKEVADRRKASKLVEVTLASVDPGYLRLWRPA